MSWQKGSMNLVNSYQSWSQSFTFLTLSLANSFTFFKARSLGYSVNCFHSFYNCLKVVTRFHQLYLFNPVSLHSTVVIQSFFGTHVWLFWTHGLQHTRLPCPSPFPKTCWNLCPLSWWCHSTISSSVIPISCLQSFPTSDLFQWVSSSHQLAKLLELQHHHQSFQWIFRVDFL